MIPSHDRTIAAQQQRAELAASALGDAAVHVAFERHPHVRRIGALHDRCPGRRCHHQLRTAHEHRVVVFAEAGHHGRRRADRTVPASRGGIDGDVDVGTEASPPQEVLRIEDLTGLACAHDDREAPRSASGEFVDRRAQRRETQTAGHDEDVTGVRLVGRPRRSVRPAHADGVTRPGGHDGVADGTDGSHGQPELAPVTHCADRHRDLPHAEGPHHHELARTCRIEQFGHRCERQRDDIGSLRLGPDHAVRDRGQRIGQPGRWHRGHHGVNVRIHTHPPVAFASRAGVTRPPAGAWS